MLKKDEQVSRKVNHNHDITRFNHVSSHVSEQTTKQKFQYIIFKDSIHYITKKKNWSIKNCIHSIEIKSAVYDD
jgi:hypothetical protein